MQIKINNLEVGWAVFKFPFSQRVCDIPGDYLLSGVGRVIRPNADLVNVARIYLFNKARDKSRKPEEMSDKIAAYIVQHTNGLSDLIICSLTPSFVLE